MIKFGRTYYLWLFVLSQILNGLAPGEAFSQPIDPAYADTVHIYALGNAYRDSVKLRWIPASYSSWQHGLKEGYTIGRMVLSRQGRMLSPQERQRSLKILTNKLKPLPVEQWDPLVRIDPMALLVAGTIYDESLFSLDPAMMEAPNFENIVRYNRSRQIKYGYCLYGADNSYRGAKAAGLGFTDTNLIEGEAYIYLISFAAPISRTQVEPAIVLIDDRNPKYLPKPGPISHQDADLITILTWKDRRLQEHYVSYEVEKSADLERFTLANEAPVINYMPENLNKGVVAFQDSLPNNQNVYFYRVRGRSPFGDWGPWSDTVAVQGVPAIVPIIPQITNIFESPEGMLNVHWQMDEAYNDQIQGFNLYRSLEQFGGYELLNDRLLAPDLRYYLDAEAPPTAYYLLEAVDLYDRRLSNFPMLGQLTDLTPPDPPIGLQCSLDPKTGNVSLRWRANTERDLKGYRVFFANNEDAYFVQVTSSTKPDTFYTDQVTMETTTEEIFYRVIAVDQRENFSDYSEICMVERPDVNPPTPPIFKRVYTSKKGIELRWANSSSSDVIATILERKLERDTAWTQLFLDSTKTEIQSFLDVDVEASQTYFYRLRAVDDDGLQSFSEVFRQKAFKTGVADAVQILKVRQLKTGEVELSWVYPEEVDHFIIFRALGDSELRRLTEMKATTPNNKNRWVFKDEKGKKKTVRKYCVQARLKDRRLSQISETLTIKLTR